MPGDRNTERARALAHPAASVAFAALYLGLALASREAVGAGFDSVARPAGGVAVLWLLLRQPGILGVDTALLAAVGFVANSVIGADVDVAVFVTAANVAQTVLAVLLLRRWCPALWGCGGERPLDRPRAVAPYCAALVVAMATGAVLTTIGITALEGGAEHTMAGVLWFGRNLCSCLVIVTFGLLMGQWLSSPRPRARLLGSAGPVELVGATAFTVVMYGLAFTFEDLPLAFLLLAATIWFGLRFSTLLSATHSFVLGFATLTLSVGGHGPFATVENDNVGYLIAQFYVAAIVVTALGLATGRDERQALAAELRRSQEEALYEASVRDAVIGSITEGLIVVDQTGELLIQNDAAAALLGDGGPLTTESRFVMSSWSVDGDELDDSQRPTARALRGETVHGAEVLVRVQGQPERVLSISGIPLPRDEVRHRTRALMIFRDVTDEHAHRKELSSFAGVVAHDLRNPLAAIDGWTEMIAEELDGGKLEPELAREFVSRVRSSSRRMRELIRDLLEHATSGARDLDESRVDVDVLVDEIAAARLAEHCVRCEPIPPVLADPVLIRQVVDNLVGNAIKYVAPDTTPDIRVRGWRSTSRLVTIQVADNGIGIPLGERDRIFDEFHRAHYRDYEGSGLGLSIVRRIVTRHGGTIVARANPAGRGSVFELTLPAYDQ